MKSMAKRVYPIDNGDEPQALSPTSSHENGREVPMDDARRVIVSRPLQFPVIQASPGQIQSVTSEVESDEDPEPDDEEDEEEVASIATLLNYLSSNMDDLLTNQSKLRKFEDITAEVMATHNDPALHRIIKAHGWSGRRYLRMHQAALDTESYLRSLANLYLSQRRAVGGGVNLVSDVSSESEKILSFLPDILIQHLTSALVVDKSGDISCSSFYGAALLVDISGFSTFAATMCSRGINGLNELHDAASGFLGDLVTIVYRYGGDVVAFAGDALICIFLDRDQRSKIGDAPLPIEQYLPENFPAIDENGWKSAGRSSAHSSSLKLNGDDFGYNSDSLGSSMIMSPTELMSPNEYPSDVLLLSPSFDKKPSGMTSIERDDDIKFTATETDDSAMNFVSSKKTEESKLSSKKSAISHGGRLSKQPSLASLNESDHSGHKTFSSETLGVISRVLSRKLSSSKSNDPAPTLLRVGSEDSVTNKRRSSSISDASRSRQGVGQMTKHSSVEERRSSAGALEKLEESTMESGKYVDTAAADAMNLMPHGVDSPTSAVAAAAIINEPDPYLSTNCCLRALECAVLLREQSRATLTTHIGVSYGEMKLAILGGHNDDWVYLLNGTCISELGPCINSAERKEVVVTKECYDRAVMDDDGGSCGGTVLSTHRFNIITDPNRLPEDFPTQLSPITESGHHETPKFIETKSIGNVFGPSTALKSPNVVNDSQKTEEAVHQITSRENSSITMKYNEYHHPRPRNMENSSKSRKSQMKSVVNTTPVGELFRIDTIETRAVPVATTLRLKRILQNSPSAVVDAAKLFVSRPVLSAIYSDALDRLGELRQVVTMFVSLDSYSPEVHKDPLTLQPFFKVVQEALHQCGGYLRQYVVDDKGCVVIAMWGVPQFSYANNSLRGLFCGVAIHKRSMNLGLQTSVGLTSGYCYCGGIGGAIRRDYVVIGDQVNMAARLMSKAHGRVLIGEVLWKNLPEHFQIWCRPAEKMKVKGSVTEIAPFYYNGEEIHQSVVLDEHEGQTTVLRRQVRLMLSSQLDKISNASVVVDQAKLMASLSIKSNKLQSRRSSSHSITTASSAIFTLIVGLPGTGKSTAAQYFEQESRKRNIECIKIQARPGDESRPYSIVRKLFLELVSIVNFREEEQQRDVIQKVIYEAYPPPQYNDDVRATAELTLEIILGLEWSEAFKAQHEDESGYQYTDDYNGSLAESPSLAADSKLKSGSGPTSPKRKLRLKVGDMTFYNVLRSLLRMKKTVIIIEDADYCDELSWNEFHLIIDNEGLQIAVLLTMRTLPMKNRIEDPYERKNVKLRQGDGTDVFDLSGEVVSMMRASGEVMEVPLSDFDSSLHVDPVPQNGPTQYGARFRPNNSYFSILSNSNCLVIEMNPLNETEINELLLEALNVDEVDHRLVISVLEVTAGNAFWCKAIARFLRENGIEEYSRTIVRRGGQFNSLRALILNRIDRLTSEQQIVAKHASIIGDDFSLKVLTSILPPKIQSHLPQSMEALQQHGLVYCVEEIQEEVIFSFQNQLIRNTIHDLTPPSDAALVHLNVAQFVEYQYSNDLRVHYPSLSYHYRNSTDQGGNALKYTVKAADQAISRGAYTDGLVFLKTAQPLAHTTQELALLRDVARVAMLDLEPRGLFFMKKIYKDQYSTEYSSLTQYSLFYNTILKEMEMKAFETAKIKAAPPVTERAVAPGAPPAVPEATQQDVSNLHAMHTNGGAAGSINWELSYVEKRRREKKRGLCIII